MQISRHWRLNPQRYRLTGVRYQNGAVSLQERPVAQNANAKLERDEQTLETGEHAVVSAA